MTSKYLEQNLHFLWEKQLKVASVFFLTNFPFQARSSLKTLAMYGCRGYRGTASGAQIDTTPAGQKAGNPDGHLWLNCLGSKAPKARKVPAYSSVLLLLLNLVQERAGKELEAGSSQCPADLGLSGALSGHFSVGSCQAFSQLGICGMQHCSVHLPCVWEKIFSLGWLQKFSFWTQQLSFRDG